MALMLLLVVLLLALTRWRLSSHGNIVLPAFF
jgi:hypothetical protein